MPGALPRVHLVTPAVVERTVARYGVHGVLTERERETLAAFTVERRRRDWLAGRVAAKRALRRVLRDRGERVPGYDSVDVWNDSNGAPRFTVAKRPGLAAQLNLSIAHTEGTGVAAVADTAGAGTVGVDIERTTEVSMAAVRRILAAGELARLHGDEAPPSAIALWTAKEAAMKAASASCTALRHVELSWRNARCVGARITGASVPAYAIVVRHRTVGPYTVAVAVYR